MTDLRERGSEQLTAVKDVEARVSTTPQSQSLVARVLAPIRRIRRPEVAPVKGTAVATRSDYSFEEKPTSHFRVILWSVIILIGLPMATSALYLFGFASDQYVAETRFAVRQAMAEQQSSGDKASGGSIMSGTFSLGGEDADIVANYIHSRAIIDDISRTVDIRALYQRPEADFYARLKSDASEEELAAYWNKMVSVYIEGTSGIVTVSASAFRREDALVLTRAILASSERLANSLSLKIRRDAMSSAEEEVRRAEGQVRFALSSLTGFRNAQHLIDPVKSSESTSRLLQQLLIDKIDSESKLFVAQKTQGPDAPGLSSLKAKLESTNAHIVELKDQLAGDKGGANMAATLATFEELELKRLFAERMYGFARDGIERARIAAARQMIYLAVFVPPSLPQEFTYPMRWTNFLLISIAGLMAWICSATITASILDHRL